MYIYSLYHLLGLMMYQNLMISLKGELMSNQRLLIQLSFHLMLVLPLLVIFFSMKQTSLIQVTFACTVSVMWFCPGPGNYDYEEWSKIGTNPHGLISSRDQRFKPMAKQMLGPGSYQVITRV